MAEFIYIVLLLLYVNLSLTDIVSIEKSFSYIDSALNVVRMGNSGNVPNHIKTNSEDYLYPHNYKNSYVKQEYLPEKLRGKKYYLAKDNKYENNLNKLWKEMRNEKWI